MMPALAKAAIGATGIWLQTAA